ncbi:MAG: hypothetical protein K2X32_01480 [Phycisphaerales bacterium]|nr:hypothetical protein [Phycisphaerales bacterium]
MSASTPAPTSLDALILGGGIAGLWTLALLRARGVRAGLLEVDALGQGQTLWSQGIIHGGVKYALGGRASAASRAISAMPGAWREALAGRGEVSLRGLGTSAGAGAGAGGGGARVLSESQVLWTTPGVMSRFAAAAASKAIRTPVKGLSAGERPGIFGAAPSGVDVYRVDEPVLEVASVLRALARGHERSIARVSRVVSIEASDAAARGAGGGAGDGAAGGAGGVRVRAEIEGPGSGEIVIDAKMCILAAGSGNAALGAMIDGGRWMRMQTRPLHMLVATVPGAIARELDEIAERAGSGGMSEQHAPGAGAMIFGHCLGASTVPRVTVTSSPGVDGAVHWLIGGGIAESGVERSEAQQISEGRAELRACLAWVADRLEGIELRAGRIDRAEGLMPDGARPDEPVIQHHGAVSSAWPTKLAFAPLLAERLATRAAELGITMRPGAGPSDDGVFADLSRASVGKLPWERGL